MLACTSKKCVDERCSCFGVRARYLKPKTTSLNPSTTNHKSASAWPAAGIRHEQRWNLSDWLRCSRGRGDPGSRGLRVSRAQLGLGFRFCCCLGSRLNDKWLGIRMCVDHALAEWTSDAALKLEPLMRNVSIQSEINFEGIGL